MSVVNQGPPEMAVHDGAADKDADDPVEPPVADDPLPQVLPEPGPTTYTIVEQGSQRGKPKLIDSNGYDYSVNKRSVTSTSWSCSIKNKVQRCPATVRQNGDTFTAGPHAHIHPADPGNLSRYLLAASLKAKARTDLHQSAMKLVEEALLELPEGAHCHPDPALLKRKANRARQALRLADSRELNNKIKRHDAPPGFLQEDIVVDDQGHFLCTENQLHLLSEEEEMWTRNLPRKLPGPHKILFEQNPKTRRQRRNLRKKHLVTKAHELSIISGGEVFVRFIDEYDKEWVYCSREETWETYLQQGLQPRPHRIRMDGTGHQQSVVFNGKEVAAPQSIVISRPSRPQPSEQVLQGIADKCAVKQKTSHYPQGQDAQNVTAMEASVPSPPSPLDQDNYETSDGEEDRDISSDDSDEESDEEPCIPMSSQTTAQMLHHSNRKRKHKPPQQFYVLHGNVFLPLNQAGEMSSGINMPMMPMFNPMTMPTIHTPPKRKKHKIKSEPPTPPTVSSKHPPQQLMHPQQHSPATPKAVKQKKATKKKKAKGKDEGTALKIVSVHGASSSGTAVSATTDTSQEAQVIELTLSTPQDCVESLEATNNLLLSNTYTSLPGLPQEGVTVVECPVATEEVTLETQTSTGLQTNYKTGAVVQPLQTQQSAAVKYVRLAHNYGVATEARHNPVKRSPVKKKKSRDNIHLNH